jgi:hypothetical protein
MVKQTNKKKHYKSYKFKTTMKRNKKPKRTHRKQLGGVINFPIYQNVSGEADVCPQLTDLNTKVGQLIDSHKKISAASAAVTNKSNNIKVNVPEIVILLKILESERKKFSITDARKNDIDQQLNTIKKHKDYIEYESLKQKAEAIPSASSATTIDISREDIKSSLTLFDFQNILNTNCGGLYLNENVILIDNNGNHVTANYPNQLVDTHVFKITPVFQVEYLGKKQKTEYPLYTFDSLYEEGDNYQMTKREYCFMTLKYLQYNDVKEVFFNISANEDIELPNYKKLRDKFITKPDQILLIKDNNNIVKNITFLNKMEEFIKLININESVVNKSSGVVNTNHGVIDNLFKKNSNNNTNVKFNEHYERLIQILKLKLKESDIDIGNGTDIETQKNEKIEKILKTNFNDIAANKLLTEKYNKAYLLDFKLFLIEGENPLVLNLNFLKFLFNKLYNIDTLRSPFKDFLYTCILLKASGFYDNIESLNEIKNAYTYIEFSSVLSRDSSDSKELKDLKDKHDQIANRNNSIKKDIQKKIDQLKETDFKKLKKQYTDYISKNHTKQLLIFFDEMNNFIIELNSVKIEFHQKNIESFTKIIICLILRVYVFYLNKSYDKIRPISVKSHIVKYLKDATKDARLEKIKNFKFKILPQTTVNFETNNKEIRSFTNCGERTIFNFFKYLLFDKEKKFITPENIDLLNDRYQGNLLKELFDGLKELTTEKEQFDYLSTKQNDFAKLISTYSSNRSNKIMFARSGKCDINPSFDNSKKMIFFLLSGNILPDIPSDDDFSELLKIFDKQFKKNDTAGYIIIDDFLKFHFNSSHAHVELVNEHTINNFILYDPLMCIIIEEINFGNQFNTRFFGIYNNLKKIRFGDNFNQPLDGLIIPKIEKITFGSEFNNPFLGTYINLKKIIFGTKFNQPLEELSIKNIEEIKFGALFNQSFYGNYDKLKKIIFGAIFNQSLDLDKLRIENIEEIDFGYKFDQLFLGTYRDLKKIKFSLEFNQPLIGLSIKNIEEIDFGYKFNQLFLGRYDKLKKITFSHKFNQSLDGLSIENIEEIRFGDNFNQSLNGLIIPKIEKIRFGDNFNQSLEELSIKNIEEIKFGYKFNQLFLGRYDKLKKITFSHKFNQSLDGLSIPPTNNVIIVIPHYNPDNINYAKYRPNIRMNNNNNNNL